MSFFRRDKKTLQHRGKQSDEKGRIGERFMEIKLEHISKTYQGELEKKYPVFEDLNFQIRNGEMAAIIGPSGAGKTTLLRILGLLETPEKGKYWLNGTDMMKKKNWNKIRNRKIGFVMQDYGLLPRLSVFDNIAAPMYIAGKSYKSIKNRVLELVEKFNMYNLLEKKVSQLSGGEAQRVAILRAVIQNPEIILADEPTGSLDNDNASLVMKLFHKLHEEGHTILFVTHNLEIAKQCEKVYKLENGKLKMENF